MAWGSDLRIIPVSLMRMEGHGRAPAVGLTGSDGRARCCDAPPEGTGPVPRVLPVLVATDIVVVGVWVSCRALEHPPPMAGP